MKVTLNKDQVAASDFIIDRLVNKDEVGVTIIGEGGTGKTTSIMDAVSRLQKAGLTTLMTAPTNKATNQLSFSADNFGVTTDCCTVAKSLGLALLPDQENKRAHKLGKGCITEQMVVVVDESSMLSSTALFDYLMPAIRGKGAKVIFMGDKFQLPPVKEFSSPALELFDYAELTKVERQDGSSPILQLCKSLRESLSSGSNFSCLNPPVTTVKAALFTEEVINAFSTPEDCVGTRALAWTNARVDDLTRYVRRRLFGRDAMPFVVGERVSTGSPVMEGDLVVIPTDIEGVVKQVFDSNFEYSTHGTKEYWRVLSVAIQPDGNYPFSIVNVIHPEEMPKYIERLANLAKAAKAASGKQSYQLWKDYHHFKDSFQVLKHCYAMTVHRSQGSTYDKVLVDVADFQRCSHPRMRKQLAYVAFSRPRSELILNKVKFDL